MNYLQHGQSQESTTEGVRGSEGGQSVYPNTDGSAASARAGAGVRNQLFTFDREDSAPGAGNFHPFGGVLDQLIDDTRKQLVKSNECIVWYREEVKEYEEKLNNLIKLKELQEEQYQEMRRQQEMLLQQQQLMQEQLQLMQQQQQSQSSATNGGETLAE
ncbi:MULTISPECIES: hypothetical protein [unclassified Microcoleus]|uniref:hypothetical protein n=1 Tax=unclassified Microcoleus TaxID=2642155 RepID=UPI002FCFAFBB